MVYQGPQWVTKGLSGLPRASVGYQGPQWVTKGLSGLPRASVGYQGPQWVTKGNDGCVSIHVVSHSTYAYCAGCSLLHVQIRVHCTCSNIHL